MRKVDLQRYQRALVTAKRKEDQPNHVERINALTRNARSAWFGLLAALVFVLVTVAGVEHIDFYGVNRTTQLPLVNVSVPTRLFFVAAPILLSAIYIYFHLYLIRLFDALGEAPARVGKDKLSQAIAPWLINDAVLWLRRRNRNDECQPKRRLESLTTVFNFVLVWCFGLSVLIYSWLTALPARNYWINGIGALSFCLALLFAVASYITLRETALQLNDERVKSLRNIGGSIMVCACMVLFGLSFTFANSSFPFVAWLDLSGEEVVERPDGFLPYQIARRDFFDIWLRREGLSSGDITIGDQLKFDEEWSQRRQLSLADLNKPSFDGAWPRVDWTYANLSGAFLSGLDLSLAQMDGAILLGAHLEGVMLRDAQLNGASFGEAQMQGANLIEVQLNEANLHSAQMEDVWLDGAWMPNAVLVDAQLEGASMTGANMSWAHFGSAQMERANLSRAWMEGVYLKEAQLVEADFSLSLLMGRQDDLIFLDSTNLIASRNEGGAIRFVDFTSAVFDSRTDFRNVFVDASVEIPSEMRAQFGDQCQSRLGEVLSDEEFFGRWRGWIESNPDYSDVVWWRIVGFRYNDVAAIAPDPGCHWKTGPMPGAVDVD